MTTLAAQLAQWAAGLAPTDQDLELADRSLLDTLAVTVAATDDPIRQVAADLPEAARWATLGHVLDFDDLHMESTTHISVVTVPTVLAAGGGARAYLAAAGVMARLGTALGWPHYSSGWHATCTAGAPAAAVGAAVSLGLDADGIARAIALAVPGAGGVQRAFGTSAKSLQVGFAAEAGLRAARLAAAGATADLTALDQWLALVGGDPARADLSGPAVPGGLAIKVYPCCYALQRPISAVRDLLDGGVQPGDVDRIRLRTPAGTVQPLIHSRPGTGLEGKFSLEYSVVAALLDRYPGFASFTDDAVRRPEVRDLVEKVDIELTEGGDWLLTGTLDVELVLRDGSTRTTGLDLPPGSPGRPPSPEEMAAKVRDCAGPAADAVQQVTWADAADFLRTTVDRAPMSHAPVSASAASTEAS
ncbi:MmgE/PrpD family protein [Blastococcus saxobsidens]|uniref:2-methylcitrate dehydratase PrpD n=1 Tax=Blastococcus saxobsidens TaxID=138336 RepID=A0A4Q7YD26_9ACTN|nr:MmgE/PrpD family protein [Blastococcus saxobsidens]RZU34149.1 2-methylcitrate dehydratase PrpD [Blastococcus saxobsidens]